jgi:hypothetical protein
VLVVDDVLLEVEVLALVDVVVERVVDVDVLELVDDEVLELVELDVLELVLDDDVLVVVGREVEVEVVVGREVDVVEVVGTPTVEVLVVDVVVVVMGHPMPQQGRFGSSTRFGSGVTCPGVKLGGGPDNERQSNSFSAVAVENPVMVVPVLAARNTAPEGLPPGPVEMSSPVEVTLI